MKNNLFKRFSSKGFTLIELLIVIAILGILATAVLVGIDPVDRINSANDSKVQTDLSTAGRAAEAYTTSHNGVYPEAFATLVASGELKTAPVAPGGYSAYTVEKLPAACTDAALDCTGINITGQLKSKKFTGASTPIWRYESGTGKNCAVVTAATACP